MDSHLAGEKWFCLRSKPRRQNVAAAHLRSLDIEVFNPQLRVRRAGRSGASLRTEPLFPNYLFAKFEIALRFRRVRYAFGVSDLVNFGGVWAVVPESEIAELKATWGESESFLVPEKIEVGDSVTLTGGLLHGMPAVVLCLLPARQRVKVLMDFLGGLKEAEVEVSSLLPAPNHPLAL